MYKIIAGIVFFCVLFKTVSAGVLFLEILPNTKNDSQDEYIELYNSGSLDSFLSGSYLEDKSGKKYIFGSGSILQGGEKKKFFRPETKILLNNSNEELFLYNSGGILQDSFSYEKTIKGEKIIILGGNGDENTQTNSGNTIVDDRGLKNTDQGDDFSASGELNPKNTDGEVLENLEIITDSQTNEVEGGEELNRFIQTESGEISDRLIIKDIPDIEIEVQSGLDILTGSTYECRKDDCKINLNLEKIFSGSYLKKNYLCNWGFGTGAIYSTGTEQKCNPGYVDYGNGIFDGTIKVSLKEDVSIYKQKNFIIENKLIPEEVLSEEENRIGTGSILLEDNLIKVSSGSIELSGSGELIPDKNAEPVGVIEETQAPIIGTTLHVEVDMKEYLTGSVVYTFQSPSYIVDNKSRQDVYYCDRSKTECKVNFSLLDSFSGSIKEKDFQCIWDFGGSLITDQATRCNPNTVIFPEGKHEINIKIAYKEGDFIYAQESFIIQNEGYIAPVKKTSSSSSSSSSGRSGVGGSNDIIIPKQNIGEINIDIQSGLDELYRCKKEDCSINLEYIPPSNDFGCRWKFHGGEFTQSTLNKCNPGYVKYSEAKEYDISLEVYQKKLPENNKIRNLKILPYIEEKKDELNGIETNIFINKNYDYSKIIISELLVNPRGVDNNEYIELQNTSDEDINLYACSLDDIADGGSKQFSFIKSDILKAGEKKKYYKYKTKINLNNSGDAATLECSSRIIDALKWNFSVASGYKLNHQKLDISSQNVRVVGVIDGDTIKVKLNGINQTVRLIGIDTPETKHPQKTIQKYGAEAYQYTLRQLDNKEVFLEIDPDNLRDKYGRLLGYIFIDNENFNKILVEKGLAKVYRKYDFKYINGFNSAEKIAKKTKIGIWSENSIQSFINKKSIEKQKVDTIDMPIKIVDDKENKFLLPKYIEKLNILNDNLAGTKSDIVGNYHLSIKKKKTGLEVSGKTIPNMQIKLSFSKVGEKYLYNLISPQIFIFKSDRNGIFKGRLPLLEVGDYYISSSIISNLGRDVSINKKNKLSISREYYIKLYTDQYNQQREIKDEIDNVKDDKSGIISLDSNIVANIQLQGRLGNKIIKENSIICFETCNINFNGNSDKGYTYIWDFGNGEIFEGNNPKYVKFEKIGKYKVTLTVYNEDLILSQDSFFVQNIGKQKTEKKIKKLGEESGVINKQKNKITQELKKTNMQDKIEDKHGIYLKIAILILIAFCVFVLLRREDSTP